VSIQYRLYWNGGNGGPVDWTTPIATVSGLSYSPPALATPSDNTFGVRAYNTATGLDDGSIDATCRIVLDAAGNDITGRPAAPTGLSASPIKSGGIHVAWQFVPGGQPLPTGFHVYVKAGSPPACTPGSQSETVTYGSGRNFFANITGGLDGTTYYVIVRAYNGTAEEPNTNAVTVVADAAGPLPVRNLVATATR